MLNLLFSPKGTLKSEVFIKTGVILIFIQFIFSIPYILDTPDTTQRIVDLFFYPFYYIWIVLWVKRYRDYGKSGWMSIFPIAVYAIGCMILVSYFYTGGTFKPITSGEFNEEQQKIAKAAMDGKRLPATVWITIYSLVVLFVFHFRMRPARNSNI